MVDKAVNSGLSQRSAFSRDKVTRSTSPQPPKSVLVDKRQGRFAARRQSEWLVNTANVMSPGILQGLSRVDPPDSCQEDAKALRSFGKGGRRDQSRGSTARTTMECWDVGGGLESDHKTQGSEKASFGGSPVVSFSIRLLRQCKRHRLGPLDSCSLCLVACWRELSHVSSIVSLFDVAATEPSFPLFQSGCCWRGSVDERQVFLQVCNEELRSNPCGRIGIGLCPECLSVVLDRDVARYGAL